MLVGHTSQVSFIVASSTIHKLEQFVSISDNDGEIKLWNNEDGRCIEHIRTNLKHRSAQVNLNLFPIEMLQFSFYSVLIIN